jgi:hypothetical protein
MRTIKTKIFMGLGMFALAFGCKTLERNQQLP